MRWMSTTCFGIGSVCVGLLPVGDANVALHAAAPDLPDVDDLWQDALKARRLQQMQPLTAGLTLLFRDQRTLHAACLGESFEYLGDGDRLLVADAQLSHLEPGLQKIYEAGLDEGLLSFSIPHSRLHGESLSENNWGE